MSREEMTFADGKYTVVYDQGHLTALRYGETWRDLSGDNLIYWMLVEAIKYKAQSSRLTQQLEIVSRNLDKGMSRSIQKLLARSSREEIKDIQDGITT